MTADSPPSTPVYELVDARSLLRSSGMADPWFLARYGANLYRGCEHACAYCDGRAERYKVEGDFARHIVVKRNAVSLLRDELARAREPGFLFVGGGVCDAYQPAEAVHRLARGVLEVALELGFPVHVLTKSALVERDLDLLERINARRRAILSFSIQTLDDGLRQRFEPGAAPIAERWRVLSEAKRRGIATGVMAMPLLPGLSDQPDHVNALARQAASVGVGFLSWSPLTLRPGVQQDFYLEALRASHADLEPGYRKLYAAQRSSGVPDPRYSARLFERLSRASRDAGVPMRAPRRIFAGQMPLYAEAAILLEHLDVEAGAARGGARTQAGWKLQDWARRRLTQKRGADAFRAVEGEFVRRSRDGTLAAAAGIDDALVVEVRRLIETAPSPEVCVPASAKQESLFGGGGRGAKS